VKTPANSSVIDNIRFIFGNNIAKELLEVEGKDDILKFTLNGYITNANYSDKKFVFLLFINHRLVDSTSLKKVIDQVYSIYLPKGSHPFVYLSLELSPNNVDVNVHPTKHEVHFLHEDAIIDKIRQAIEKTLTGCNSSRNMYTQSKLPSVFLSDAKPSLLKDSEKKTYAHEMVRVDKNEQKIDKFFKEIIKVDDDKKQKSQRQIRLKSILNLRGEVEQNSNKSLLEFVKNLTFVGVISHSKCLVQSDVKLYLCESRELFSELFYQIILFDFANFGVINFGEPIGIAELAMLYLETPESGWTEEDGPKEELAEGMARYNYLHSIHQ